MISKIRYKETGFTLIELLVVVAIIGILASVVLASLNSARQKGQIAAIKSNLKNMMSQAELLYDGPNNYSAVCLDPTVTSMLTSLGTEGATAKCYSYTNGTTDINTRWGVSAKLNQTAFGAYSADSMGVVTWDTQGVNASGAFVTPDVNMNWAAATAACALAGGRLPSIEELQALWSAYGGVPTGFTSSNSLYWSATLVPPNGVQVYETNGGIMSTAKTNGGYVRCVR